jgi:hypothetical protein
MGDMAGSSRGDIAEQRRQHTLRKRVGLEVFGRHQSAESRLVADVAADGAFHQARQCQLRESDVAEIADSHDSYRREVARMAGLGEFVGQRIDERLRNAVSSTGPADPHRRTVLDLAHGIECRTDVGLHGIRPPLLGLNVCPRNKADRWESRNITASATSDGSPNRPRGSSARRLRPTSPCITVRPMSVLITPGATALALMPRWPNSREMDFINAMSPALAAE